MGFLRRLWLGVLSLLVIAGSVLFAIPARVHAASTYEYVTPSASNNVSCPTNIAILETTDASQNNTLYAWCYVANTTHEFARGNTGDTIEVAYAPGTQGTLNAGGNTSTISIADPNNLFSQAFPSAPTQPASDVESCESIGNWAWMACPLVNMMSGAIEWLDDRIQGLLYVDSDNYDAQRHPELYAAWMNIRNLAYIILIPVMLIMVIGTALGFDIFTAYTIKKALPRMVLAVLFITLSWHITTFLIDFFNVIGSGILGFMTSPFGLPDRMSLETLFGASNGNAGDIAQTAGSAATQWAVTLGSLVALAALVTSPGGLVILMLYLAPVVLFVLAAFLILTAREIFILAGVLLAPLAILAWIFPGNDKLWKLWWNMFSKLLMMFPLIMIVLGAGRIFAFLLNDSGNGGILNPLLKLTAYIIPYIFIPFAFKFAGGTFANLAGFINDREKGIFDRMRKSRGERLSELKRRAGRNRIFDAEKANKATGFKGRWMRGVNTAGGWLAEPLANAQIKLGTEKGKAIIAHVHQGALEDSQKLMEVLSRNGFNAEELSALSLGRMGKRADGSRFHIRAWNGTGHDLYRIADELESSVDEQDRIGGRHLRTNAAFLTEVNRSEEYGRASVQLAAGLAYAAQGFATPEEIARLASLQDGYKYKTEEVYGTDKNGNRILVDIKHVMDTDNMPATPSGMGALVKTNAELLAARAGGLGKPGYGVRVGADGQYYATSTEDLGRRVIYDADLGRDVEVNVLSGAKIEQVIRTGVQDLSAAKGSQLTSQLSEAISQILTAKADTVYVQADGSYKKVSAIRDGVEETLIQVMGSYAAPDVKRRVYDMLIKAKTHNLATERGLTEAQVREEAEAQVRRLLQRSSGAIDPTKLDLGGNDENEKK